MSDEAKFFQTFVPELKEDQSALLSWLCNNPTEVVNIQKDIFWEDIHHKIYDAISFCIHNNHPVNVDIIYDRLEKKITKDIIRGIFELEYLEENIPYLRKKIEDANAYKKVVIDLDKLVIETLNDNSFGVEKLQILANRFIDYASTFQEKDSVVTALQLSDIYKKELEKRAAGDTRKRTLGYSCIDRNVKRPAEAGEMTIIFGYKGSGKSLLLKCMENAWINLGICVLSINLEMTDVSNMDRLVSMRTRLSLDTLLSDEKDSRTTAVIHRDLQRFSEKKNYMYYKSPELNLNQLDSLIHKAKQHFKKEGVLPEDEYMIVTIDLLDMVEEFSDADSAYQIKKAVNKLHKIYRKHNVFMLPLVQANENVVRGGRRFSDPEACDSFSLQPEDIEGASAYGARARVILAINRPLVLKRRFFREREEEWDIEIDKLILTVVKQNDGKVGVSSEFVFDDDSFRLMPYKE